ncbi:MAG TPA: HAD-IA family hydrolase [Tahibacter sp.]|uniref:HAD family hydrolase n=1 Tax=Tahibacter sp. TaxID=2056211 RepID=UPI002B8FDA31|nr:HAD-IA family hydrolase [Tahibacter sp.]HSX59651.1 HAD-IA family hydrolase [Tahibacter sp.]
MTPSVILVDFDGVLRRWPDSDAAIESPHGLPPGSLRAAAFDRALLAALVEGRLSDADWRNETAWRLREHYPHADVTAAVAQWSAGIGTIDRDLLSLLQRCTPPQRLVLVSNGSTRLPQDLDAHGIAACFHTVVNSSAIRIAKPAAGFFEIALARAGVTAADALFIDDSTDHVAAARMLGIRSHVYNGIAGVREFLGDTGLVVPD